MRVEVEILVADGGPSVLDTRVVLGGDLQLDEILADGGPVRAVARRRSLPDAELPEGRRPKPTPPSG
jgi:hypothetical protein